jgi:hypothetical protein
MNEFRCGDRRGARGAGGSMYFMLSIAYCPIAGVKEDVGASSFRMKEKANKSPPSHIPATASDARQNLKVSLKDEHLAVPITNKDERTSTPLPDRDFVARADGGKALRGFVCKFPRSCKTDDESLTDSKIAMSVMPVEIAVRAVLDPPTAAELKHGGSPSKVQTWEFSSSTAAEYFISKAAALGYEASAAISGNLSLVGKASTGAGFSRKAEEEISAGGNISSTSAVHVKTSMHPMCSFMLDPKHVNFNESALGDLHKIKTHTDATIFLKKYGSHVFVGQTDYGGYFMEKLTMTSATGKHAATFTRFASSKFSAAASASGNVAAGVTAGAECKGGVSNNAAQRVNNESTFDEISSDYSLEMYGPHGASVQNFEKCLIASKEEWKIINRVGMKGLGLEPIWKLVEDKLFPVPEQSELARVPELLKKAFVEEFVDDVPTISPGACDVPEQPKVSSGPFNQPATRAHFDRVIRPTPVRALCVCVCVSVSE